MFEKILTEHFPLLEGNRYYFDNLRPAPWPKKAHRWFYEMRDCLADEGFEIRDYEELEDMQLYLYDEGWSFRYSRGSEIDGAWFIKYIVLDANLYSVLHEITLRHEFIHHFIGLTYHPLTEDEVGQCIPGRMVDSRRKRAEPARPSRAFPRRPWRIHRQRVGRRPPRGDELLGGAGVRLGPLGDPGRARILPEIHRP